MVFNKNDIKSLVKKIIKETIDSDFKLVSPETKLEFLITSIQNMIDDIEREGGGDMVYCSNRLQRILNMTNNINESINLNEWRPNTGYDEWANIETGGAHGRGVQHRKNFTRKENSKYEQSSKLQKPSDYRMLITQWGDAADEYADKLFKSIISKYKKGLFTLGDVHSIGSFIPETTKIAKMLNDFVDEENKTTGFYPSNFRDKTPTLKQQPK